jgi:uncharacterized protein
MTLLTECYIGLSAMVALFVLFSPRVAERLYRPLMFEPLKYPKGHYRTDELQQFLVDSNVQDIFIPIGNGKNLHAWYFANRTTSQTIMICHGNEGNISDMSKLIKLLLQTGASVLIFDYQGYGVSDGTPSINGICEDALAVYDWLLKKQHLDPKTIVLYGESMGASVAGWLIQQRTVAGIILQSASTNMRRIAHETFPLLGCFPHFLFPRPYFDNIAALRSKPYPLLVIHGSKDRTVIPEHAKNIFAAAREPKRMALLANTAHDEINDLDKEYFCDAVRQFLRSAASRELVHD